ncbi:MAG: magnesium transporter [Dehalococcoidia bacterium]
MDDRAELIAEHQVEAADPVEQVIDLLRDDDTEGAVALVADLRAPDAAEVLEHLSADDLGEIVPGLDVETISGAMEYTASSTRSEIVRLLEPDTLAETIAAVPDDIATDLVHDLDDETAAQVMEGLSDERREELEQLLTYPDDTAGGRMTGQVITVLPELTAGQAIEQLRTSQADASKPFYLYVTRPDRTLEGVLNVRALITAPPGSLVTEVMTADLITIEANEDQEEAARVLQRHNLLALPVVDQHGHLLGTITSDDLFDVLQEEATEDLYRLALVHEDEDLRGIWSSVRNRMPWLTVNLVTVMAAAWVVAFFESTLAQVAILAAFLPVIGGHGGNAGIQTLTIVVRSLAIDRIGTRDTVQLVRHEAVVGILMGVASGLLVGAVAWAWQGNGWLGLVVFVGLVANVLIGTIFGVLIPMALSRLKQDPALSGGIWLTTATDICGFLAFLGTAAILLDRLQ